MEDKRRKRFAGIARPLSLRAMARLSGQSCIFPFYHMVSCSPPSHIRHLYPVPSEKEFAEDMEYLLRHFEPISIADYLEGKSGNKRQMVLSFDDGLVECHQFIAPFLKQKGIPGVFHLNNDFIDNRGLFYRYRASMLIDHLAADKCHLTRSSEFLEIPEDQVREAILMINYQQRPLLESLAMKLEFDEASRMKESPVYMSTAQVQDLVKWGFDIGAHGADHAEYSHMEPRKMASSVTRSMKDIKAQFNTAVSCFAFPFTSDGVPEMVIDQILREGQVDVLFGTAGLKLTGNKRFVQRIPMESMGLPAGRMLKAEYLYFLAKSLVKGNRYFRNSH